MWAKMSPVKASWASRNGSVVVVVDASVVGGETAVVVDVGAAIVDAGAAVGVFVDTSLPPGTISNTMVIPSANAQSAERTPERTIDLR